VYSQLHLGQNGKPLIGVPCLGRSHPCGQKMSMEVNLSNRPSAVTVRAVSLPENNVPAWLLMRIKQQYNRHVDASLPVF
jgi:hypothetical protein